MEIQATGKTDFNDDDVMLVAKLAKQATRKASRRAKEMGFSCERKDDVCIIRAPNHPDICVPVKTTPVDVTKRYVFVQ